MKRSALYTGQVMHQRLRPLRHALRYRVFWICIDLDELEALDTDLRSFSHNRFNVFSLHDRDYGDGGALRSWINGQLADAGLADAAAGIRLVTMPRIFGYAFNPISLYYCHRADGALGAILYEVHNTFGERHNYLFAVERAPVRHGCNKGFHVSPFLGMDMNYAFRTSAPDERLALEIIARHGEQVTLTASMVGRRETLNDGTLVKALLAMPLLTLKVTAAIHWHALCLWVKGLRVHHKPAPPAKATTVISTGQGS